MAIDKDDINGIFEPSNKRLPVAIVGHGFDYTLFAQRPRPTLLQDARPLQDIDEESSMFLKALELPQPIKWDNGKLSKAQKVSLNRLVLRSINRMIARMSIHNPISRIFNARDLRQARILYIKRKST